MFLRLPDVHVDLQLGLVTSNPECIFCALKLHSPRRLGRSTNATGSTYVQIQSCTSNQNRQRAPVLLFGSDINERNCTIMFMYERTGHSVCPCLYGGVVEKVVFDCRNNWSVNLHHTQHQQSLITSHHTRAGALKAQGGGTRHAQRLRFNSHSLAHALRALERPHSIIELLPPRAPAVGPNRFCSARLDILPSLAQESRYFAHFCSGKTCILSNSLTIPYNVS